MPHRTWSPGEEVIAADFNPNVADQVVAQYANAAARAAAWPSPPAGAMSALTDAAVAGIEQYNAGQWRKPWNLPWGLLAEGHNEATVAVNAEVLIPGCSVTVTVPANRRIKVTGNASLSSTTQAIYATIYIKTGANTYINGGQSAVPGANQPGFVCCFGFVTPPAGANTFYLTGSTGSAGGQSVSSVTAPKAWIAVEDVGPAGAPALLRDVLAELGPDVDTELPDTGEPPELGTVPGLPPTEELDR